MGRPKAQKQPKSDPTIREVWDSIPDDVKEHIWNFIDGDETERRYLIFEAILTHDQRRVMHMVIGLTLFGDISMIEGRIQNGVTKELKKATYCGCKTLRDINYIL